MSRANLPRKQSLAVSTMVGFARGISADPARYGLSLQDAADLQAAVDALAVAFRAGNPLASRTRVDVAAKDHAFAVAERAYRRCYSLIKWNDAVSDSDKIGIGVRPVNRTRVRAVLDRTAPVLGILQAAQGRHVLSYRGGKVGSGRRKPVGATQLQVFVAIGDGPIRDPAAARLHGCFTRSPFSIGFRHEHDRKRATYFARWVSLRGEFSAFSIPISMTIAA